MKGCEWLPNRHKMIRVFWFWDFSLLARVGTLASRVSVPAPPITHCVSTNTPSSLFSHSLFLFLFLSHTLRLLKSSRIAKIPSHSLSQGTTTFFFFSLFFSLMADNLDDGEFWLPPQFLADDDAPVTPLKEKRQPLQNDALLFPSEFPYGFASSELASPVDSTAGGSSETESDEEEQLVAELSLRVARSSLQTDNKSVVWITTTTLFVFLSTRIWCLFRV